MFETQTLHTVEDKHYKQLERNVLHKTHFPPFKVYPELQPQLPSGDDIELKLFNPEQDPQDILEIHLEQPGIISPQFLQLEFIKNAPVMH